MSPREPAAKEPQESSSARGRRSEPPPSEEGRPESEDLTPILGANLRRLRVKRGLSLERLAKASGVSRAMLGQMELGHSTPTINLLWKVACALSVPFSTLLANPASQTAAVMPARSARKLISAEGTLSSRALFPFTGRQSTEFYELVMAPHGIERAEAHPPGTKENLVVSTGSVRIKVGKQTHLLGPSDAIVFEADQPHEYANPGDAPTVMYLVMTYADLGG